VLVPGDDPAVWTPLLEQGWGQDAVVVFAGRAGADLAGGVRRLVGGPSQGGGKSPAITGWCWPSVLGPLLTLSRPATAQRFLGEFSAALFEFADLPETWQIAGTERIRETLVGFGMKHVSETPTHVLDETQSSFDPESTSRI
jgi:hypothetical protein